MNIQGIHHVAYRCKNAKQTVEFYQQVLAMDFQLAIAEDRSALNRRARPLHACVYGCRQWQCSGLF